MLPRSRRLTDSRSFSETFRSGVRAGTPSVVVHMHKTLDQKPPETPRVGFVVSKKVGNAVIRNRVKRRLRHLVAPMSLPFSANVVIRALPPAATKPDRLAADLASAWERAKNKAI